jgi:hypothetical protein
MDAEAGFRGGGFDFSERSGIFHRGNLDPLESDAPRQGEPFLDC